MFEAVEPSVATRLMAASYAAPVVDRMREIADDVASWDAEGLSRKHIDGLIRQWMDAEGIGFAGWLEEPDVRAIAERFPEFDMQRLWRAYSFEEWVIECVWSVAFTDEPIPFYPFTMGYMYDDRSNPEFPLVVAVMTPLTDVKLAVRQIENKLNKEFGARAVRQNKKDEVRAARMLAMKRQGMSLKEIAIQTLREQYPDIVRNPRKYKAQIETEKSRVAKRIKSAEEVWKQRGVESSTPE